LAAAVIARRSKASPAAGSPLDHRAAFALIELDLLGRPGRRRARASAAIVGAH